MTVIVWSVQVTVPGKKLFFYPFPNNKFWTLPYSKSLQTTILSLMKRVENTLGQGEIAHEQFLLFPHCFQKTCPAKM